MPPLPRRYDDHAGAVGDPRPQPPGDRAGVAQARADDLGAGLGEREGDGRPVGRGQDEALDAVDLREAGGREGDVAGVAARERLEPADGERRAVAHGVLGGAGVLPAEREDLDAALERDAERRRERQDVDHDGEVRRHRLGAGRPPLHAEPVGRLVVSGQRHASHSTAPAGRSRNTAAGQSGMLGTTSTGTGECRTTWVAVEPKRRPGTRRRHGRRRPASRRGRAAAIRHSVACPRSAYSCDLDVVAQPGRRAVVLEVGDDRLLELRERRDVAADHRVGPRRGREVPHADDVERHPEALREVTRATYDGARCARAVVPDDDPTGDVGFFPDHAPS